MNNKLIAQYGEEILSYRLRSARQKNRMRYEDFDKHLLATDRKISALYEKKRNLGWQPLLPPIQRGYKRMFVLREDVAETEQATFYQAILDKINTVQYSSRKDFTIKRRKYGRKIRVEKPQYLQKLCSWEFERCKFSEKEKLCFRETWEMDKNKNLVTRFVFEGCWRFVLKVLPNMITQERIKDALLETEIAEIDNYLERNFYQNKLTKLLNGNCYKHWKYEESIKQYYLFKNKSHSQIIDMIKAEFFEE
jgi:hypothetical protein